MIPITGVFLQSKKSVLPSPIPKPCFTYSFYNPGGQTKGAGGINCDGTVFVAIVTLGQTSSGCLFEGTQFSSPSGLTITQGAGC